MCRVLCPEVTQDPGCANNVTHREQPGCSWASGGRGGALRSPQVRLGWGLGQQGATEPRFSAKRPSVTPASVTCPFPAASHLQRLHRLSHGGHTTLPLHPFTSADTSGASGAFPRQ